MARYYDEDLERRLIAIYEEAERKLDRLIRAAAERKAKGTERFYENQRAQVRLVMQQVRRKAAPLVGRLTSSAYRRGVGAVDLTLDRSEAFAGVHTSAEEVLAANLAGRLRYAEEYVGRKTPDVFRTLALEEVGVQVASGIAPRHQARDLEARLRREGITGFVDRAGRRWRLSVYARMVTRTTTREASSTGIKNRLLEHGFDLVSISQHRGSCPICLPYQGKTYSLTGRDERFPSIEDGPGRLPPFHPNCRHVLLPATTTFEDMERALGTAPEQTIRPRKEPPREVVDPVQQKIDALKEKYAPATPGTTPSNATLTMAGKEIDALIEEEVEKHRPGYEREVEKLAIEREELFRRKRARREIVEREASAEYDRLRKEQAPMREELTRVNYELHEARERWFEARRQYPEGDPRIIPFWLEVDRLRSRSTELQRELQKTRSHGAFVRERSREDPELQQLRDEMEKLSQREADLKHGAQAVETKATLDVLNKFRPFGGASFEVQSKRGKAVKRIDEGAQFFPRDWIERANENQHRAIASGRAGHLLRVLSTGWGKRSAYYPLSNGPERGNILKAQPADRARTPRDLVHELVHFFEDFSDTLPNGETIIGRLESDFYKGRTQGEPSYALPGYRIGRERFKNGGFFNRYVGKDYSAMGMENAYEVASMGLEYLFFERETIKKDPEHLHLMLGMLGLLPGANVAQL